MPRRTKRLLGEILWGNGMRDVDAADNTDTTTKIESSYSWLGKSSLKHQTSLPYKMLKHKAT
jgi:hypothetical protein